MKYTPLIGWTIMLMWSTSEALTIFVRSYSYSGDFKRFKRHTKRSYASTSDEQRGYKYFCANRAYIAAYENATFKMTLMNRFADMDSETFNGMYNGYRPPSNDSIIVEAPPSSTSSGGKQQTTQTSGTLALTSTSKDWRTAGYVSAVPYQGACGSCWAIAALGALESAWYKSKGAKLVASVQNVLDCAGTAYGNSGCVGGAIQYAWDYIVANRAVNSEAFYPYVAVQNPVCKFNASEPQLAKMLRYYNVAARESSLLTAVTQIGPIAITIDASQTSFQLYSSGIYSEPACLTTSPNHGVLLVGFGVDSASGVPFWLIRNSWGTGWGEAGYMRIVRNQNNMCGVASNACYPVIQ